MKCVRTSRASTTSARATTDRNSTPSRSQTTPENMSSVTHVCNNLNTPVTCVCLCVCCVVWWCECVCVLCCVMMCVCQVISSHHYLYSTFYNATCKAWKATVLTLSRDRYDTSSFTAQNWWRSDKYDLNHANALPLMPTEFSSLLKRMLWSIVALRSRSTNREIQPRSDDKSRSFVTLMRAVSVLRDALNPYWTIFL